MRWVIKSDAESGDGVSIEREQPSTAFKPMPHITTYGGSYFSAQPEKDSFGSFEPRQANLQEASSNDQLIGGKALNWSELCDVGTLLRKADDFIKLGDIKGGFQADELTGNFNALNKTTNVRPNKGESISIIHPQFSEANGRGDSITGEGRPTKIWTNGGASTFEDRMPLDFDSNDVVTCNGITLDTEAPSMSMHQSAMNSAGGKDLAENFLDAAGSMTETFEPAAGMNSFGESLNPVAELGTNSGPGGSTFMTGRFDMPTNNLTGSAGPGGDDI